MSSWRYAYFFPNDQQPLTADSAIVVLSQFGLEFDNSIRLCVCIDDDGHMLDSGDVIELAFPKEQDLRNRLSEGQQFSVQCRNAEMFVSCVFTTETSNPCMFFAWPRKQFFAMPDARQSEFHFMLLQTARTSNAAYVITIDDAPDQFQDRFLNIDGKRMLDTVDNHGYGHGIQEVWIDVTLGIAPPDGVATECSQEIGNGYVSFDVRNSKSMK